MTRRAKKGSRRPWWRKRRNIRRAVIAVLALLVTALGVTYVLVWGRSEEPYSIRYASHFTLPTTAGGETTLGEHLGQHNVLLYFNEGMG